MKVISFLNFCMAMLPNRCLESTWEQLKRAFANEFLITTMSYCVPVFKERNENKRMGICRESSRSYAKLLWKKCFTKPVLEKDLSVNCSN